MQPDNEEPGPSPYEPLPHGADLRVAIRRTVRVGEHAGMVLEDLGVQPDVPYELTRRDVLERNADLIDVAIDQLRDREVHSLEVARVQRHRSRPPTVRLRTRNVDRVNAQVGTTWLRGQRVRRGAVTFELADVLPPGTGTTVPLEAVGYLDDEVVAGLRTTIDLT